MFIACKVTHKNTFPPNLGGGQNRGEGWTFYASKSPDVKGFKMQKMPISSDEIDTFFDDFLKGLLLWCIGEKFFLQTLFSFLNRFQSYKEYIGNVPVSQFTKI